MLLTPYTRLRDTDMLKLKDPQVVVAAAKLPILKPNEFDLWKMRIKQYFLVTDYSLWENELKARGTLLMALPDKHQLKFNIHKDAKSLMEAIEKRFGGNKETKKVQKTLLKQQYENFNGLSSKSLDQIHDRLQKLISQLEILVSVVPSVIVASTKVPVSTLPNVDNLSDAQMAMLTMRARRFLQRNLGANGTTSIGFDMSKVECYNCHRRGYFARECMSPKDTRNKDTQIRSVLVETSTSNELVSKCDSVDSYDWSFQADKEPTNYALMAFTSSSSASSSGFDSEVAPFSKACSKAYATLQLHYDKLTVDFRKSQFDVLSYKSDISVPTSPVHDRYKSGEGYHAVPPPYTGTFMPPKPDLVFHDAPIVSEIIPHVFNVKPSTTKPTKVMSQSNRYSAPIIKDWVSDSEDESEGEPMPTQKEPSFVQPSKHVRNPRISVKPVKHPKQAEHLRKDITKSGGHKHSWNRKAYFVCKSVNHLIKDYDYFDKKMVQNPVWNHAMRPVTTIVPLTNVKHQMSAKHVVNKPHSPIIRPINHRPAPKNSNFYQKVTTVTPKMVNAIKGTKGNWVWKPKCTVLDHVSRLTSASMTLRQMALELASPKQMALGKDESNPFIVDSLLKKYMVINTPCYSNKALAIQGQTATGNKESTETRAWQTDYMQKI
uniref:CCHC-type domain-containing protein n=1 Tax=Tanacetum cinerariifolium TaxID=118510 RepID=A0A6L2KML0_TANCI|nr:hypothetical protein [Tanacetum cinerariifolium]